MRLFDIDNALRTSFGPSEGWDKDGIQVNCHNDIKKVLIALDCTSDAVKKAVEIGADCIVTHHPLIFNSIQKFDIQEPTVKRVYSAVVNSISVLSYHTCLDITEGGVNDSLCNALGIKDTFAFLPFARFGTVNPIDFSQFTENCEKALGSKAQNVINSGKKVNKVAVLSGMGRSYVADAYKTGADTYVTGELTHDSLLDAAEYGMNVLCLTHFATENVVLPFLAKNLTSLGLEAVIYGV